MITVRSAAALLAAATLFACEVQRTQPSPPFPAQAGWIVETPTSAMRKAQFRLPPAGSDAAEASLVVYYFGGQGGSVEANIERWVGQMQQADGKPSTAVARKEIRTVNGLKVTLVDVDGTYVAETAPGAGARHNKPHFRLRAGVVETPKGPYFIKLTGPEKTVTRWNRAYDQFVGSMKAQ